MKSTEEVSFFGRGHSEGTGPISRPRCGANSGVGSICRADSELFSSFNHCGSVDLLNLLKFAFWMCVVGLIVMDGKHKEE